MQPSAPRIGHLTCPEQYGCCESFASDFATQEVCKGQTLGALVPRISRDRGRIPWLGGSPAAILPATSVRRRRSRVRMLQQFASDNNAGICPEAFEALRRAN